MTAALGGVCIEKHYTIDKDLPDVPDHAMSVDPGELAEMVRPATAPPCCSATPGSAYGPPRSPPAPTARRSVVLERDVAAGVA